MRQRGLSHIHIYIYTSIHRYIQGNSYVYVYIYIYLCIYIYIYMHIHIHIYWIKRKISSRESRVFKFLRPSLTQIWLVLSFPFPQWFGIGNQKHLVSLLKTPKLPTVSWFWNHGHQSQLLGAQLLQKSYCIFQTNNSYPTPNQRVFFQQKPLWSLQRKGPLPGFGQSFSEAPWSVPGHRACGFPLYLGRSCKAVATLSPLREP